jgi:iron complex transport system ATP-binding protein
MIEIENVSFARQGTPILEDISLAIPAGGVTALVGPNGAGKSTLLSLMARLLPLDIGKITIAGKSVAHTRSDELARTVAILRQDTLVSSRLRVGELVGFGRFPHSHGRLTEEDRRLIDDALREFDLTGLADRFVETLSGGQRQRAMVAMAYCQGCDYMLLDEPLNNLDMFYARELMRILRGLADRQGKTIVIVLHDINHAATYADRIVALRDGKLVSYDSTEEVLVPERLEQIFGYRMQIATVGDQPVVLHHR